LVPFRLQDFVSGPDAWDVDEYGRVAELIVKGRGNFQGFHTYPLREPLVWVGLEDQFDPSSGNVTWSYNTSWATTMETGWGYTPVATSDYGFGAPAIFPSDCFGNEVNMQEPVICPFPTTMDENNELFNRAGRLMGSVMKFAKSIGVQTTVGTESPMTKPLQPAGPQPVGKVPLWLYYSESRQDSLVTTTLCTECEGLYDFGGIVAYVSAANDSSVPDAVALCQWYNNDLHDNWLTASPTTPPAQGYGYVRTEGYVSASTSEAALADPSRVPLTQYVKASIHDHRAVAPPAALANATADGYISLAALGLAWPAPENVNPPTPPSTEDFYRGIFKRLQALEQPPDQYWIATPEGWEWDKVNISNPLVQEAVADMLAADAARNAVAPDMRLATYGWVLGPLGNRSYLDGVLPDDWTMSSIDQLVGWAPVDPAYENITHHEKLVIPWAEDDPRLTAPELWVNRSIEHGNSAELYNASGLINIHWRTRAVSPQVAATAQRAWGGGFTSMDFWADWCQAQFGPTAAGAAASLFESVDSFSAPMPVSWVHGPGGISPSSDECTLMHTNYSFVDPFCALKPSVLTDVAAGLADAATLERLDYWCSSFQYWRQLSAVSCSWSEYQAVVDAVSKISDPAQRVAAARAQALPARQLLVANVSAMMQYQLQSASTVGERGITTNLRSHSLNEAVFDQTAPLMKLANLTALPAACLVPQSYTGQPRFRVPSPRGVLPRGDDLRVKAFALLPAASASSPEREREGEGLVAPPTLYWREHGSSQPFNAVAFSTVAAGRMVYQATLPAPATDVEWYADLKQSNGQPLEFPPGGSTSPQVTLLH
jgi:hypothetical protein